MWIEEVYIAMYAEVTIAPPLTPADLAHLAEHLWTTGDMLPGLMVMVGGLVRRRGAALEMCPSAAVLSQLLHLERALYQTPPRKLRAKLRLLQRLWLHMAPRLLGAGLNATDDFRAIGSSLSEEADLAAAKLLKAVAKGFARLEAKLQELEQLVHRRKHEGFEAQLVLPFCWPFDQPVLDFFFSQIVAVNNFTEAMTLYLYDLCYALFPPGSPAYDLRNELEVELDKQQRPSVGGGELPPKYRLRGPLPGALADLSSRFRRTVIVPFHEEIPMGIISAVMRHVAFNYERLPDLLFFFHPDVVEHVQEDAIVSVLKSAALKQWPPETRFLMLGHRHMIPVDASGRVAPEVSSYCRAARATGSGTGRRHWSPFRGGSHLERFTNREPSGSYCQWLELAWELLFGRPFRLPEDVYGGYDFGQLVVTREAARSRPRAFWARAWKAMCTRSNYELLLGTKFVSFRVELSGEKGKNSWTGYHKPMECVFEHLWHVLFNPDANSWLWPTRLRDPTLPLTFKFEIGEHNHKLLKGYWWTPHEPL